MADGQVKNIGDAKPFALELEAMRSAHAILSKLEPGARLRVLTWLQSAAFDGEQRPPFGRGPIPLGFTE